MVQQLCREDEIGFVDLWDSFVGKEEMYFRADIHLSGKGAAVLTEGMPGAVATGLGIVRYLNKLGRAVSQIWLKTYKRITDATDYRGTHHNLDLNAYA